MAVTMDIGYNFAKDALQVTERGYPKNPQPPKVALENQLTFCYTDFNDENFMFASDPNALPRLYIVDFEHASFLPLSFLDYAVLEPITFVSPTHSRDCETTAVVLTTVIFSEICPGVKVPSNIFSCRRNTSAGRTAQKSDKECSMIEASISYNLRLQ